MQLLWFLTAISFYLQLSWARPFEGSEDDRNSDNDNTVAVPLILVYGGFHYAEIGIGTPPQKFKVFFDTWNRNTWITSTKCPAEKFAMCRNHARYDASKSTSKEETPEKFSYVEYGTTINGTITKDIVTLGSQTVKQPFGEAMATDGETLAHSTFDGSFGIGVGSTGSKQPTILESLVNQRVITKKVFGIYARSNANGEIMFGGYNEKLYTGKLEFVNVSSPQEWIFDIKSIMFGEDDLTGRSCQGVVNDGSHHIYGPKEQVEKIYRRLNCNPQNLCEVDCSKIKTFPQLKFTVGQMGITIGPEDYIDKEGDKCTGRIFHLTQTNWVLGNLFLDKLYTAYDVDNNQIGFALAAPPASTISIGPTTATTGTTTTTTATTTAATTTTTKTTTTTTTPPPTTTEPTTTSAASTLDSNHKSLEILAVMAVLRYLQMYTS